ncbi:hypothetical protein C8J56DRAFT_1164063 [Mycena floridula]|nr:hypothetical protein C8J56DRAFT_1164063 [Mycena floridula]
MPTIVLSDDYVYVAGGILSTIFVLVGQGVIVGRARETAGIQYPQLYAEKAEAEKSPAAFKFNCAQRAHQNSIEKISTIHALTLLTSIKYPKFAAAASLTWSIGRGLYTRGYLAAPEMRNTSGGILGSFSMMALLGGSVYTVGQLLYVTLA